LDIFIPKEIFKGAVNDCQSDKWNKKVRTWNQFVFMFYAILTGNSSLREVIANFALKKYSAANQLAWLRRTKFGHKVKISTLKPGNVWLLNLPGEAFVEYQLAAK